MKKILILAIFSLLFVTEAFAVQQVDIIGGDTINFGKVLDRSRHSYREVIIKNISSEKIKIPNIKVECGCTKAYFSKIDLEPGDTATLHIKLDLPSHEGELTKHITLFINDTSNKKILTLKATVYSILKISPYETFVFNNMELGVEKISAGIKVINKSDKEITIKSVKYSSPDIHSDLKENTVIKPNDTLIVYAFAKTAKYGRFDGSITVDTDTPETDIHFDVIGFAAEKKPANKG